jgi:hypothetical protein
MIATFSSVILGFALTSTGVALVIGLLALVVTNGTTLYLSTRQHTSQRELDAERWRTDRLLVILHDVLRLSDAGRDALSSGLDSDDVSAANHELSRLIRELNEARLDLDLFAKELYRRRAFALTQLLSVAADVRHDDAGWSNWQAWMHNERAALVEFARSELGWVDDWSSKGSKRPSLLDIAKEHFGTSTLSPDVFCGQTALQAPPRM